MLWAEKNWDEKYLQSLSKVFQLFGQLLLFPASCFLFCLGGLLLEQWERRNYSSTEAPLAGACFAIEHHITTPAHWAMIIDFFLILRSCVVISQERSHLQWQGIDLDNCFGINGSLWQNLLCVISGMMRADSNMLLCYIVLLYIIFK